MHYDVIVEPPQQQNRGSTDIAQASHNITFACTDGLTAAMAIHRSFFLLSQHHERSARRLGSEV